jgi:hypothetical protein
MTLEELINRKFNERLTLYKGHLFNSCNDWEDYQRLRGYCQGMADFMSDIAPLIADPDKAEDES